MEFKRWKAKVYHKMRWYYIEYIYNKINSSMMYISYRHVKKCTRVKKENNVQYLTKIVNPTAGIGDQLASWITGYYFAEQFGLAYAYSPLYPNEWNEFLGFGENVVLVEQLLKKNNYRKIWLPYFEDEDEVGKNSIRKIIRSYQGEKVVFYIEVNQVYGEQYGVMVALKKMFEAAPARRYDNLIFNKDDVNIAVHIRRGDITISQENQNPKLTMRWLDNNYYVNILEKTVGILQERNYRIFIFSQGNEEDFKEFRQFENIVFCLDMSAMDSFLHMVRADILVTSKSSFSYKPALLADGLRICPRNFWHDYPDAPEWILVDDYGNIGQDKLKKMEKLWLIKR